jgi:WD repeat and SOF domain-containing protein 1
MFKYDSGRSFDVYHTKRMQHIFAVSYSSDAQYILSGSDDTNIRIWKSHASDRLGVLTGREDRKIKYNRKLKERFNYLPEIQRIKNDKHVPKRIKKAKEIQHIQNISAHRKQENRKKHSKSGDAEIIPERSRAVIKEFE